MNGGLPPCDANGRDTRRRHQLRSKGTHFIDRKRRVVTAKSRPSVPRLGRVYGAVALRDLPNHIDSLLGVCDERKQQTRETERPYHGKRGGGEKGRGVSFDHGGTWRSERGSATVKQEKESS